MEIRKILQAVDHTLLSQTATWEDIRKLCEEGMRYKTASVCIPPLLCKKSLSIYRRPSAGMHGGWFSERL